MAAFHVWVALATAQPGYTDADYYFSAASRLASGQGLTVDLVWNFLEAPDFAALPIASHRFWMPLASAVQAAGIALTGARATPFVAAQTAIGLVALLIVPATYLVARRLGAGRRLAAVAGLIAGLGGVYAPAWPSLDNFAPVAVLGTLLLASLDGLARGSRRSALLAGLALGGLVLARADGAIYALVLLFTFRSAPLATLLAVFVAAAVVVPWEARNAMLGFPDGELARAAFITRYEDFFALAPPDPAAYLADPSRALAQKGDALAANAETFARSTLLVLGPVALIAAWPLRGWLAARAWLPLAVVLYLVQSLVFTLHSTQGSFAHSFAGLLPTTIALGVVGLDRVVARPGPRLAAVVSLALLSLAVLVSVDAVQKWHALFDPPFAARQAVAPEVATPALVIDAAAWRQVLDGPTLVTPADGLDAAHEVADRYGARTLVLERAHFSAYDALYRGDAHPDWLTLGMERDGIQVWRIGP